MMVTVQLELHLVALSDKYLLKKKIELPREPDLGELVRVSMIAHNGDHSEHFVRIKNKIPMTEGDSISRYRIVLEASATKHCFVNAAIVEHCNWVISRE